MKYPKDSGIPRKMWRRIKVRGKFIMMKLAEIQDEYGVDVRFCGDRITLKETTIALLRDTYENY